MGADTLKGGDGNDILYATDSTNSGDVGVSNTLYGEAGNDTLYGAKGNDILDGGLGSDKAYGNDGNDTFIGSLDNAIDTYFGGNDIDTVDYSSVTYNLTLTNGTVVTDNGGANGIGTDTLVDIEIIQAGSGNDVLSGGASNSVTIYGNSGKDTITAGDIDNNLLYGGSGNDTITGGSGVDTIYGDDNNDIIQGRGGKDTLDGGLGSDKASDH